MKIVGIGNAIIDVICKVQDDFLIKNKLTKTRVQKSPGNDFPCSPSQIRYPNYEEGADSGITAPCLQCTAF